MIKIQRGECPERVRHKVLVMGRRRLKWVWKEKKCAGKVAGEDTPRGGESTSRRRDRLVFAAQGSAIRSEVIITPLSVVVKGSHVCFRGWSLCIVAGGLE